jgi:hypothetical protein
MGKLVCPCWFALTVGSLAPVFVRSAGFSPYSYPKQIIE